MIFIQSSVEINRITVHSKKLLTARCSLCDEEIEFVEGDTIYGDKWYHSLCWKALSEAEDINKNLTVCK